MASMRVGQQPLDGAHLGLRRQVGGQRDVHQRGGPHLAEDLRMKSAS